MDPDSTERGAEDLWDLTIDDLFSTSDAAASDLHSALPGQYTIDLCTSVEPASELAPSLRDFEQLHAYQVTDWKDDRLVFRLRLGPVDSELEADAILSIVRGDYPQATALPVGDDDLRMIAIVAGSAPARDEAPMAPAATAARDAAPPAAAPIPAPTIAAPAARDAPPSTPTARAARAAASRAEPAISPPKAVTPTTTQTAPPPPPVAEPMDFAATFRDLATELLAPIAKAPRPRPRPPEAPAVPPPPVLTAAVAGKGAPPATAPRAAAPLPAAAPPVLKLEEVARPPRERAGPRDAARGVGAEQPRAAGRAGTRADSPAHSSQQPPATDVAPVPPTMPGALAAPIAAPRPTPTAPVRRPESPPPALLGAADPPAVTAPAAPPVRPVTAAPAERTPTNTAAPPAKLRPQETAAANPVPPSTLPAPSRASRLTAAVLPPASSMAVAQRASAPPEDAPASRPAELPRVSLRARPQTPESTVSQPNAAISAAALIVEPDLPAPLAVEPPLAATPATAAPAAMAAVPPRPAAPDVEFELELLADDSAAAGPKVVAAATWPPNAIPAALLTTLELVPDELPRPAAETAGVAAIEVAAQAPPAAKAAPLEPPRAAPTPRAPHPAPVAKPPSAPPQPPARPEPAHGAVPAKAAAVAGRTAPGPAPSKPVAARPAAPQPAPPKPAAPAPAVTRPPAAKPAAAGPVRPTSSAPAAAQKPAAAAPKAAGTNAGPAIDSTQTLRALVLPEKSSKSDKLLVIQLMLSEQEIAPENVPNLAIFNEYRLYSAVGHEQGKVMHALRLGFFTDEGPAEAVAGYLRAYFDAPVVTRVSFEERDRFAKRRVDARMNSSDTGIHTAIELSSAPSAPATSLADLSARARNAEPGKVSRGRS